MHRHAVEVENAEDAAHLKLDTTLLTDRSNAAKRRALEVARL